MSRARRASIIGRAASLLLGFLVLAGCGRKETASAAKDPDGIAAPSSPAAPAKFAVPFRGVIKAREKGDPLLGLGDREITYTIADGKIRREAVLVGLLSKLPGSKEDAAGIICDFQAGQVVLYRRNEQARSFVRMTLAEYRKQIEERADLGAHVGTFFMAIPRPLPEGRAVNQPEARTAAGEILCDRLIIELPDATYEVWHSQQVKVDRSLLGWVELNLPAEVSGFPCFMKCVPRLQAPAAHPGVSKERTRTEKAADWVVAAVEKAMKQQSELLQVLEGIPTDADFTLDPSFGELASLDDLHRVFRPATEGGVDWD